MVAADDQLRAAAVASVAALALAGEGGPPPAFRQERKPLQGGFRRLSRRLAQLAQQQLGDHVQAGHEVAHAVRVVRSERLYCPRFERGRVQAAVSSPIASCMAAATASPGAVCTAAGSRRALAGRGLAERDLAGPDLHCRGLAPDGGCAGPGPGVPAVPAATWPPAAAPGRRVARVARRPAGALGSPFWR